MRSAYWLVTVSLFLFGCAPTTSLSKNDLSNIESIFVEEDVIITKNVTYVGPEHAEASVLRGLFGIAGKFAADDIIDNITADQMIFRYMEENKIDIGEISKTAVVEALSSHPELVNAKFVKSEHEATTRLSVEVVVYGIVQTHGFSDVYRPTLGLSAKMVSQSGDTIWQDYQYLSGFNGSIDAIEFEKYFEDTGAMESRYEHAAELVSEFIYDDF